jgi:hypothetical protein
LEGENIPHIFKKTSHLLQDIPIIAITSASKVLPSKIANSCGIITYLRKPVSLSELDLLIIRLEGKKIING